MFELALAQLRFGASMAFGFPFHKRSLDRLLEAMRATLDEFGAIGSDAEEILGGPRHSDETLRAVQLQRYRKQALRAAAETSYYEGVFETAGVDPKRMSFEDIARFPITPKEALREHPDSFVRRNAKPFLRATTTGTTGWPTTVYFSEREFRTILAFAAMSFMTQRLIGPEDVVQISISSRAVIGVTGVAGACAQIGAPVHIAGAVSIPHTLALLSERKHLPGKRPRVSIMTTYPSYLGELVEYGLSNGYKPSDFGLRRIMMGGEVGTDALKRRCQELFGPVEVRENYGMTELVPFGGTLCTEGHLHFEPAMGLIEVLSLDGSGPAAPGEPGTVVATPSPPYRETTLLLRYNTEDVVRALEGPLTCSMAGFPATTHLLGKQRLSVRHEHGWTLVRDVIEALESLDDVPLPARYGFWPVPGGVAVEVVARGDGAATRRRILDSLEEHGVPVRTLRVCTDRSELTRPLPLRCDLKETSFAKPADGPAALLRTAAEGRR
jgi:phenylacetate-coenzyme A ligase PaaK-like adenylate-forming protein